ncbi:MAG: intrarane serine protease GlpG [Mucilaginibacter sp.]|nr:intrarane serine protease GlpG [Mucilaginibacter sp.]
MTLSILSEYFYQSPVTYILMLIIFLISTAGLLNRKLFFQFILHPQSVIRDKQYYRILTADLMNADIMHLMLNEFMLFIFCTNLEFTLRNKTPYGSLQFLTIYVSALIFASVIVIARHYKEFGYSTTGTSGSIMGCMFGFMLIAPNYIVYRLPGVGEVKNIYGGLIYIVVLILYQRKKKQELVNNEYHFYGAIGGIIATLALHPEIISGIRG